VSVNCRWSQLSRITFLLCLHCFYVCYNTRGVSPPCCTGVNYRIHHWRRIRRSCSSFCLAPFHEDKTLERLWERRSCISLMVVHYLMHSRDPDVFHVSEKRYKTTGSRRWSLILAPPYHPALSMAANTLVINQNTVLPQLDLIAIAKTTRKTLDRLASFSRMRRYAWCSNPSILPGYLRDLSVPPNRIFFSPKYRPRLSHSFT